MRFWKGKYEFKMLGVEWQAFCRIAFERFFESNTKRSTMHSDI